MNRKMISILVDITDDIQMYINIMERKQAPHGRNSRCIEQREEGEKERDTQAFHKQSVPEHTCHACPQSQLKVRWQACSDLSNHFPAMLLKPTSVYKSQPHTHIIQVQNLCAEIKISVR